MIDCAKIGERSAPRLSSPAPPLSPLFYLPPPIGSLRRREASGSVLSELEFYVNITMCFDSTDIMRISTLK